MGQTPKRTKFTGDNTDKEEEHQQQTNEDDGHDSVTQTVEATEDIRLRTNDGHATARLTKRFVEDIAVLAIQAHTLHTLLATLHGIT